MRKVGVFNLVTLDGYFKQRLNLKLTKTRTFNNGNVLLCYEPD
jgi:hypothetical protein